MGKIMMRQVRGVPIKKVLLDGGEEYEVHPDFLNPDCKFKKKKNSNFSSKRVDSTRFGN